MIANHPGPTMRPTIGPSSITRRSIRSGGATEAGTSNVTPSGANSVSRPSTRAPSPKVSVSAVIAASPVIGAPIATSDPVRSAAPPTAPWRFTREPVARRLPPIAPSNLDVVARHRGRTRDRTGDADVRAHGVEVAADGRPRRRRGGRRDAPSPRPATQDRPVRPRGTRRGRPALRRSPFRRRGRRRRRSRGRPRTPGRPPRGAAAARGRSRRRCGSWGSSSGWMAKRSARHGAPRRGLGQVPARAARPARVSRHQITSPETVMSDRPGEDRSLGRV